MDKLLVCLFFVSYCVAQMCAPEIPSLQNLEPFSTNLPSFLERPHTLKPGSIWGSISAPYPTNSFFTNIGLNATYFPIAPYPYHLKVQNSGVTISYSQWKSVTSSYITTPFIGNLILSSDESALMQIDSFDQMSVILKWSPNFDGSMTSPIVRGSPYITMNYNRMTPIIRSSHALLSINGNGGSGPFTDTHFSIFMNNGQTWKIYSLNGVPITFYKRNNQLVATTPFTGTLRATVITNPNYESILDSSSETYPIGANLSYSFQNDLASIQFKWRTMGGCPESLLMMALPHHVDSLVASAELSETNVTYQTIKGTMVGFRGAIWTLGETLTSIKWNSPNGIPENKKEAIISALRYDKGRRNNVGDTYTAGKILSSMARLALIADEVGDNETAYQIRENLKADIDPWLSGTNWNSLRYESSWGGICSTSGLADMNADYGQGWYNDHHFHYGYFIYAAAVIGKGDSTWLLSRKSAIMDIVRDFANPSSQDPFFPVTRNKDWFDGHSWASGLFPFGDSKNQESTSESVNAYYGVYLLGESMGDNLLRDWGRLLLATEIRSVQKYWQITEESQIYPEPFKAGKMVGVLWSTKVDYATFFGGNIEFIHCIQMMPFTPITEQLLPAPWVQEEYPVLSKVLTRNETLGEGWKGFVFMDHAIIDKEAAWSEVQTLAWYDNGNSKTNTLYWVATRPSSTN